MQWYWLHQTISISICRTVWFTNIITWEERLSSVMSLNSFSLFYSFLKTNDKLNTYSFSRSLTRYNWFIWHNFPNHSYSCRNKDTFSKLLTHFSCLHSVFCKITHKNTIIFHSFNHVLVQKTQTYNITTSRIAKWTQIAHSHPWVIIQK